MKTPTPINERCANRVVRLSARISEGEMVILARYDVKPGRAIHRVIEMVDRLDKRKKEAVK